MIKICFYCEKEIEGRYTQVAIDRPYINLYFHKECFYQVLGEIELSQYLSDNYQKLSDFVYQFGLQTNTKKSKILKGK